MAGRVRIYIAASLDGFIAGPNDELDWLGDPSPDEALPEGVLGFERFLTEVGAMVMGRRTYDVVAGFDGPWMYGELPIHVWTTRPLTPTRPTVRPVHGDIDAVLDEALERAAGKDVYVDGGATVRAAMAAGRVAEIVLTMVPIVLGRGLPLFAGLEERHALRFVSHRDYGRGLVQLVLVPAG